MVGKFTFRVIGPGLDWLAQLDTVEELDGVPPLVELFVEKFKRDAARDAKTELPHEIGGV